MLQPVIENDNNNNNKLMREMGSQIFYYEQKLTTAYNTFLFFLFWSTLPLMSLLI